MAGVGWTQASSFRVGFGERDVTPSKSVPMWGYGARHAMLSQGTLDPLFARAIVIEAGGSKVALVGLDLGRGPTREMMTEIRQTIREKAQIEHVLISGSHTHHGPVIELTDREGRGKKTFDDAVAYSRELPQRIAEAILAANASLQEARFGLATKDVPFNRNRHAKRLPKPTDPMLAVMRFDDAAGQPLAILVNFAAHPVMTDVMDLRFSADYPGFLQAKVAKELSAPCVFMQGASGDLSPNPGENVKGPQAFGEQVAAEAIELAKGIQTSVPGKPSLKGRVDQFKFRSRTDFSNPLTVAMYSLAFFPALIENFVDELKDGIPAELNTVILNDELALVGGSGEFFCNHSVRLKQRSYLPQTLFFGYCNGHNLYFPTIEAASEGGYGADEKVSPVELGAGEQMMNRALINIYELTGRLSTKTY